MSSSKFLANENFSGVSHFFIIEFCPFFRIVVWILLTRYFWQSTFFGSLLLAPSVAMSISQSSERSDLLVLEIPDDCEAIALCGGPYSNFAAVEAFLAETAGMAYRMCLGDMGGFGPLPNRTISMIREAGLLCLQGNYDDAVGNGLRDCGCGYSEERDRYFAQLSYDYTYAHTALEHREWMRSLPKLIELHWRDRKVLLCHGSPDQVNEFVWQSETGDTQILDYLNRYGVDGICGTHSGIPWMRQVTPLEQSEDQSEGFWLNVGVLGRPANTGEQSVNYALLRWPQGESMIQPQIESLDYDVAATASVMREEGLPEEFVQSLETGIWTTCAAILPEAEREVMPRRAVVA